MESIGFDLDRAAWASNETKVKATAELCLCRLPARAVGGCSTMGGPANVLSSHSLSHLPASEVWLQLGRSQEP